MHIIYCSAQHVILLKCDLIGATNKSLHQKLATFQLFLQQLVPDPYKSIFIIVLYKFYYFNLNYKC